MTASLWAKCVTTQEAAVSAKQRQFFDNHDAAQTGMALPTG